jgi:hypothetical protein
LTRLHIGINAKDTRTKSFHISGHRSRGRLSSQVKSCRQSRNSLHAEKRFIVHREIMRLIKGTHHLLVNRFAKKTKGCPGQ